MRKDIMKTGVTALAIALALEFAVAPTIPLSQAPLQSTRISYSLHKPAAGQKYTRKAARMPKCEI